MRSKLKITGAGQPAESNPAGLGQWLSGRGGAVGGQGTGPVAPAQVAEAATLTILYASQTGNAKSVASNIKAAAESQGLAVALQDIASYKTNALTKEKYLIIVTSTYGEGEPPERRSVFINSCLAKKRQHYRSCITPYWG